MDFKTRLKETGWKYFLLALCDVEANYLVVKAYQYTNLTSIQVSLKINLYLRLVLTSDRIIVEVAIRGAE